MAEAGRITLIDRLRGFALLGIVLIHAVAFAAPGVPPGADPGGSVLDRVASVGVILLVESKFYATFSFLFGVGFALQLAGGGRHFLRRYLRRMFALLLFGLGHVVLLWEGDILAAYAVVGTVLILFRNCRPKTLVIWAGVLLVIPLLFASAGLALLFAARLSPEGAAELREADAELVAAFGEAVRVVVERQQRGDPLELLAERVEGYKFSLLIEATRAPSILAMFLLGLWAGKVGLFADVAGFRPLLRRVRFWGLTLGLASASLVAAGYFLLPPVSGLAVLFLNQFFAGPVLAGGYVATLALWWRPDAPPGLLASAGRTALTNYLAQSLCLTVAFYGYGLGLVGRIGPAEAVGVGLLIYAGLATLSLLWLRRYRYGPMEWLWRAFTRWDLASGGRQPPDSGRGEDQGADAPRSPPLAPR